jgi:hypothetical protein
MNQPSAWCRAVSSLLRNLHSLGGHGRTPALKLRICRELRTRSLHNLTADRGVAFGLGVADSPESHGSARGWQALGARSRQAPILLLAQPW